MKEGIHPNYRDVVFDSSFGRYLVNSLIVGVVATLGIVLAALYILLMYQRTMTGETPEIVKEKVVDLRGREVLAIAPLLVVIIGLGFYPKPVLDVVNPAVDRVMVAVGATDPAPQVAPVAEGAQP